MKTRDELEARWKVLYAQSQELEERQARIIGGLGSIEEQIGQRALAQLEEDRAQLDLDLQELRQQMEEHGGFK